MNAERRKEIKAVIDSLTAFKDAFLAIESPEHLAEDIERIESDEDEFYNNMPESMQAGAKGEEAQARIDSLHEAEDALRDLVDSFGEIGESVDSIIATLETAGE